MEKKLVADRIEMKEVEEHLPVILTQEELIDRSRKLAKANQDNTELENQKKDVVADFNAQAKKIESILGMLSRIVSTGKEYRDVKCVWTFNYTQGYKELKRLDTEEIVRHVELSQTERQGVVI